MHTSAESTKSKFEAWQRLVDLFQQDLQSNLSEVEISALVSWTYDCYDSYGKIYREILGAIEHADSEDYDLLEDCVVQLYSHFRHIASHFSDAERGILSLMRAIAAKKEQQQDGSSHK